MRLALLLCLLALPSLADPPVPLCFDETQQVRLARELTATRAERDDARRAQVVPVVIVGTVALAVGFVVGVLVQPLTRPHP
jgi:hypothetical protein